MADKKSLKHSGLGRPQKADPHHVIVSANVLQVQLSTAWSILGTRMLAAESPKKLMNVLKSGGGIISGAEDYSFSKRMFEIIHDKNFPQVRTKSQIHFLADSLGASGLVTPRRSREICAKERSKVRHAIVRRDFYIECSCGYEGPALNGACRKCGTTELSEELRLREEDYET